MKKSKIILSAIAVVIGIVVVNVLLDSCKTKDGEEDSSSNMSVSSNVESEDSWSERQPNVVKVYIDASGSMRDYFGKSNIANVSDALTGLGQATESN